MKLEPIKEQIINMYTIDNITTTKIAKIIGASQSGVESLLKKNNINVDHGKFLRAFSQEQIKIIGEKYKNGMTTIELADMFGVTDHTIAKAIRSIGIEIRAAKRRSPVENHRFFEIIDTPEKAYYLGWMITDGSVVRDKRRKSNMIRIELIAGDKYIIDKFAMLLGASPEKVKIHKTRNHAYFGFTSQEMSEDLSKYGVIPNKTYTAFLPEIKEDLYHHMMRGAFDGNGTITISNGYPKIGMYGTEMLCNDFKRELMDKIGFSDNKVSKSTCYHVWWSGKENLKKFYEYLYKDCGDLYLKRKKEKFEKYIF